MHLCLIASATPEDIGCIFLISADILFVSLIFKVLYFTHRVVQAHLFHQGFLLLFQQISKHIKNSRFKMKERNVLPTFTPDSTKKKKPFTDRKSTTHLRIQSSHPCLPIPIYTISLELMSVIVLATTQEIWWTVKEQVTTCDYSKNGLSLVGMCLFCSQL